MGNRGNEVSICAIILLSVALLFFPVQQGYGVSTPSPELNDSDERGNPNDDVNTGFASDKLHTVEFTYDADTEIKEVLIKFADRPDANTMLVGIYDGSTLLWDSGLINPSSHDGGGVEQRFLISEGTPTTLFTPSDGILKVAAYGGTDIASMPKDSLNPSATTNQREEFTTASRTSLPSTLPTMVGVSTNDFNWVYH